MALELKKKKLKNSELLESVKANISQREQKQTTPIQQESFAEQVQERANQLETQSKHKIGLMNDFNNRLFILKSAYKGVQDFELNVARATGSNIQNQLAKGEQLGEEAVKKKNEELNKSNASLYTAGTSLKNVLHSSANIANAMAKENTSGLYKTKAVVQELMGLPMKTVRDSLPAQMLGGAIQLAGAKDNTLDEKAEEFNKMINLTQNYINEEWEKDAEGRGKVAQALGRATRSASSSATSALIGTAVGSPTVGLGLMGWGAEGAEIKETLDSMDEVNYGFAEKYGGEKGNIDINHRKVKQNDDGSISTEKSITIGVDVNGKEKQVVIPTIIDGEEVSEEEAIQHFYETGEFLGSFDNEKDAERFAEDLHLRQEEFYDKSKMLQKAIEKGDTAMTVEIMGEKLLGGIEFGGSLLSGLTDKALGKVKNEVARFLIKQGFDVSDEILEEQFSNLIDGIELVGEDEQAEMAELLDYLKQTSGQISTETALSTIIMKLLTFGYLGDIQEAKNRNDLRGLVDKTNFDSKQKTELIKKINEGKITNNFELVNEIFEYNKNNKTKIENAKKQLPLKEISGKRGTAMKNNGLLENAQQITQEDTQMPQNETSQEITTSDEVLQELDNFYKKLEQSNISNEEKGNIALDFERLKEEGVSLNEIKQYIQTYSDVLDGKIDVDIQEEQTETKPKEILDTTKTYKKGRSQTYARYANDNSDYDRSSLDKAKELIRENNQGRRTKEQWLNIAKQIGTDIANLSDEEVEKIAYRTWLDERPNNKSSLNRQGQKFVDFNSDEWLNTIYNQVKETRAQNGVDVNQNNETSQDEGSFSLAENIPEEKITAELPKKTELLKNNETKEQMLEAFQKETENIDAKTKGRKHLETYTKSKGLSRKSKANASKLYDLNQYIPITNAETVDKANQTIDNAGVDESFGAIKSLFNDGEKRITLNDFAVSERLVQIYDSKAVQARKAGDEALAQKYFAKASELMEMNAVYLTEMGQIIQAASIIKKMSPEGQIEVLKKMIKRTNVKEGTNLKLSKEQEQRIIEASGDAKQLEDTISAVTLELANEIPPTTKDKLRAWRHLAMLGNMRTHNRNIIGNLAMHYVQGFKNKVAGAGEGVANLFYKDLERTKTLKMANQDQKDFAKLDWTEIADSANGNKYSPDKILKRGRKSFSDNNLLGKGLNWLSQTNSNLLEKEDAFFMQHAYRNALANYMKANNLSSEDLRIDYDIDTGNKQLNKENRAKNEENKKKLQKAREYAINQAQEATFHQFSALANTLNQIEQRGGVGGFLLEATVPFTKTPINIAKTGVEYSPVGIARAVGGTIQDITTNSQKLKTQLKDGTITQAEYNSQISKMVNNRIDQMAKGLTGSSITAIGYVLAQMGVLKGTNKDEKDKFEDSLGKQDFSIQIGDQTISLEWLAPTAIPLFIGANIYDFLQTETEAKDDEDYWNKIETKANSLFTGLTQALEPMTEMSMLQGIANALSSYEQGSSAILSDILVGAGTGYLSQYNPTALGQIAKIIDPYERDTTSTKKGFAKKVDQFLKYQQSKIPFASKALPTKANIWGEEQKRADNLIQRFAENALLPYTRKDIVEDITDQKLIELFDESGENVFPNSSLNKTLTFDGEKYNLTSTEYNQVKKTYGKTAKSILNNVLSSDNYSNLSPEEKVEVIKDVYKIANEQVKIDYAKEHNIDYESSSYDKYNSYKTLMNDGDTANYFIFKNQQFDAKDENGETVNGLKKKRVATYLRMAGYSEKEQLYLFGTEYKLDAEDKKRLLQILGEENIPFEDVSKIVAELK